MPISFVPPQEDEVDDSRADFAPEQQPIRRSRGRPARKPEPAGELREEVYLDENGEPITRKSRRHGSNDLFELPKSMMRSGWAYGWWAFSVAGQPIDASTEVDWLDGGWRPVRPSELKAEERRALCPPGWSSNTIERHGQRLYKRPMHLHKEAQEEDYYRAREMRDERMRQALVGDSGQNLAPRPGRLNRFEVQVGGMEPESLIED